MGIVCLGADVLFSPLIGQPWETGSVSRIAFLEWQWILPSPGQIAFPRGQSAPVVQVQIALEGSEWAPSRDPCRPFGVPRCVYRELFDEPFRG